ncbi:MAG: hypothetical protein MASP_00265 [Candidatus Methanolliviera sp. GoM_asphalt]|nr:MAG: hypothetical protein MASP_00265 [Candidatus Methanolliviera sp. GoM_asphalt]
MKITYNPDADAMNIVYGSVARSDLNDASNIDLVVIADIFLFIPPSFH